MSPRYSVIMPVYNLEKVVGRCVYSILTQSFRDFELIIVDDGSEDSSFSVCCGYAQRDSRIKLFRQMNKGVSAARNTGIANAVGEYIVFVDGDDYASINYLTNLDKSDADLVIAGFHTEDEYGNEMQITEYSPLRYSVSSPSIIRNQFENSLFNNVYSKRFRRSILHRESLFFDDSLSLGEDTCFTVSYLRYIDSIETIPNIDYSYVKYTSRETLTNQKITPDIIGRLERSYTRIEEYLRTVLGEEATPAVAFRLGKIYNSYIELFMNDSPLVEAEAILYLFRQKWFKQSLCDDRLYKNENRKFRFLLKIRSGLFLITYKRYRNKVREYSMRKK